MKCIGWKQQAFPNQIQEPSLDVEVNFFIYLHVLKALHNCSLYIFLRMHSASSIKQKFLKKWIMGLQLCNSSKKNMTIMERRKAIKLSADLALASVRNCTTRWSRALVASASQNDDNQALLQHIIGSDAAKHKKASIDVVANSTTSVAKKIASKKILKRSWGIRRVRKLSNGALKDPPYSIAKRLVKKRTQLLKNLVPGGESMDAISLIEETLDYMVWLRAQVDVMRSLARASERLDGK